VEQKDAVQGSVKQAIYSAKALGLDIGAL